MSTSQTRERGKSIKVALSETERANIEAKAQAAGLSLSGYSRAQLLGSVTPRTLKAAPLPERQELARLLAQLGKVGANLNQLTHRANTGQSVEAEALAATLAQVRAAADDIRQKLK